ncbi:MAG TPA: hypothetical protein VF656_12530 [Pyrinomonadaceae bacterium]
MLFRNALNSEATRIAPAELLTDAPSILPRQDRGRVFFCNDGGARAPVALANGLSDSSFARVRAVRASVPSESQPRGDEGK